MLRFHASLSRVLLIPGGLLVALLLLTAGCATTSPPAEKVQAANFTYTPPDEAVPASTEVTFLQIRPEFISNFSFPGVEPFVGFAVNLESDLQELLAARGFTARGPYATTDEIVYADRQNSDFYLLTHLDLTADVSGVEATEIVSLTSLLMDSEAGYRFKGDVQLGGTIRIAAVETMTKERLWVKTVDLPGRSVQVDGQDAFERDAFGQAVEQDAGIRNPLTTALEEYYQTFMDATWAYLDPAEMAVLKAQADELKERKRY